jgi:hypothetical protein
MTKKKKKNKCRKENMITREANPMAECNAN